MSIKQTLVAAGFSLAIATTSALASTDVTCTSEAKESWKPIEHAVEAVKAKGYKVTASEVTAGACYKISADIDGKTSEMLYNPVTLEPVERTKS